MAELNDNNTHHKRLVELQQLIDAGFSNQEMAARVKLSSKSIAFYVKHMHMKQSKHTGS